MKMNKIKLVYFSPTGTCGQVARAIADGIGAAEVETIDITGPETRKQPLKTTGDELLLVAVPVYMGRIPALLQDWFNALEARKTPAVCVVVYGNRAYENALLELTDTLAGRGCVPVAGGAYIGEHSFADDQSPVAAERPDEADLGHAKAFGRNIRNKVASAASIADLAGLKVPGEHPYGGRTEIWNVDFISVDDQCVQCGLCAKVCPMGAVDPDNSANIDIEKCITCCACIKKCPQNARSKKPGPVKEASQRLFKLNPDPKQPECFL